MSKVGSPVPLSTAFARAVSHAESADQRSDEVAKTVQRLVQGNQPFAIEQSHQQAVSDAVTHLSVLQTELGRRRRQLYLVLADLQQVGLILQLTTHPAKPKREVYKAEDGNVVSLLHRRLRRHGGDRLTADMAGRVERLSDEIDLLNQTIETEFKALSDIIHR
ncbi:MAG TPA: hypothetical protein VG742_20865 [Dongiaceae bacterium]|nr:hypothetical protein [Dongiaceae bacterium]